MELTGSFGIIYNLKIKKYLLGTSILHGGWRTSFQNLLHWATAQNSP